MAVVEAEAEAEAETDAEVDAEGRETDEARDEVWVDGTGEDAYELWPDSVESVEAELATTPSGT